MKSIVVPHNSCALRGWHGVNRPEEFVMEEGEGVGEGRDEGPWQPETEGKQSSLTTDVTRRANAHLHFRKFATWFIYRGLTIPCDNL